MPPALFSLFLFHSVPVRVTPLTAFLLLKFLVRTLLALFLVLGLLTMFTLPLFSLDPSQFPADTAQMY